MMLASRGGIAGQTRRRANKAVEAYVCLSCKTCTKRQSRHTFSGTPWLPRRNYGVPPVIKDDAATNDLPAWMRKQIRNKVKRHLLWSVPGKNLDNLPIDHRAQFLLHDDARSEARWAAALPEHDPAGEVRYRWDPDYGLALNPADEWSIASLQRLESQHTNAHELYPEFVREDVFVLIKQWAKSMRKRSSKKHGAERFKHKSRRQLSEHGNDKQLDLNGHEGMPKGDLARSERAHSCYVRRHSVGDPFKTRRGETSQRNRNLIRKHITFKGHDRLSVFDVKQAESHPKYSRLKTELDLDSTLDAHLKRLQHPSTQVETICKETPVKKPTLPLGPVSGEAEESHETISDTVWSLEHAANHATSAVQRNSHTMHIPCKTFSGSQQIHRPFPITERHMWHRSLMYNASWAESARAPIAATRLYHASNCRRQRAAVEVADNPDLGDPIHTHLSSRHPGGIREQLRQWQDVHGHKDPIPELLSAGADDPQDMELSPFPDDSDGPFSADGEAEGEEGWNEVSSLQNDSDGADTTSRRFLQTGDLAEIHTVGSERPAFFGVFVESLPMNGIEDSGCFLTMSGKWLNTAVANALFSVPGWVSPKSVEPTLDYLSQFTNALTGKAAEDEQLPDSQDRSIPRHICAPLVSRLRELFDQSQAIYRRHATSLDNAHNILAHENDLRYGSLTSAATALLRVSANEVTLPRLLAVRKAIHNGGYAFSIDARSHRRTGHLQIRSKAQVRLVQQVRDWIREWQDDQAACTRFPRRKHHPSRGARILYDFVAKARDIVLQHRENRQTTEFGNVGPSKVRLPLTKTSDCVTVTTARRFTDEEQDVIRFLEAWCCSSSLAATPRLQALPPLILRATGLYADLDLTTATGYLFMQEIGVVMPYDNRLRFDQNILLPSSQHSKSLQNLMSSLLRMRENHNLSDSMAGLRHDWKNLTVYCVDNADAREIDDGVSIEPVDDGPNAQGLHWVHSHIANPTAFFSRDHPLAKMARHMGESIYMPERAYMMMPRWATNTHFSLRANRPCLTFSAKLDERGNILDFRITPGIVRNVVRLTPSELASLLGETSSSDAPDLTILSVGGDPPPSPPRNSRVGDMTDANLKELQKLSHVAKARFQLRDRAGGVSYDIVGDASLNVWQNWDSPGLAWDHPFRMGSRAVEGDPIIRYETNPITSWVGQKEKGSPLLVRECMLLAGEVAARWCEARQIPSICRGSVESRQQPGEVDINRYRQDVLDPATRPDGSSPMHLVIPYLWSLPSSELRTTPSPHRFLGLDYFSKVTSPLRRYGDMIVHWQIEAALREEARTGKSLVASPREKVNRSFLPFSASMLRTIMIGLQPRESLISKAKRDAINFWTSQLLFRLHHFGEDGGLPYGDGSGSLPPLRVFVHSYATLFRNNPSSPAMIIELNRPCSMAHVDGLEPVRFGDVWEVKIARALPYARAVEVLPIRLVGRDGAGIL